MSLKINVDVTKEDMEDLSMFLETSEDPVLKKFIQRFLKSAFDECQRIEGEAKSVKESNPLYFS